MLSLSYCDDSNNSALDTQELLEFLVVVRTIQYLNYHKSLLHFSGLNL